MFKRQFNPRPRLKPAAMVIVIVLAGLSGGAGTASAGANPEQRFCGRLMNREVSSEHVTILRIRPDKTLAGEYTFADGETDSQGTLKEIPDNDGDPLTATLRWTDPYGTGLLKIRFDADYKSFEGKWGSGENTPDQLWFGDPCK